MKAITKLQNPNFMPEELEVLESKGWVLLSGRDISDTSLLEISNKLGEVINQDGKPILTMYNDANSEKVIFGDKHVGWHNERIYIDQPPKFLLFACESPPSEGGKTMLVDGHKIALNLLYT